MDKCCENCKEYWVYGPPDHYTGECGCPLNADPISQKYRWVGEKDPACMFYSPKDA